MAVPIPQNDGDALASLIRTRNNILAEIEQQTLAIANSGGASATYSLGGRQVSWNEWLTSKQQAIDKINMTIATLDWAQSGDVYSSAR